MLITAFVAMRETWSADSMPLVKKVVVAVKHASILTMLTMVFNALWMGLKVPLSVVQRKASVSNALAFPTKTVRLHARLPVHAIGPVTMTKIHALKRVANG